MPLTFWPPSSAGTITTGASFTITASANTLTWPTGTMYLNLTPASNAATLIPNCTVGGSNTVTVESLWRQTLYPGETAEERQVREERERQEQRERQVQRQAAAAERRAADERAERLLSESLDPIQLAEYRDRGHFHVQVSSADGPRRYRIERGWVQNVRLVDRAGRVRRTYCIHPAEQIPIADSLLAQKLLLEADEDTFLALANAS